jgi:phage shock protein E
MISIVKKIFGSKKENVGELLEKGAVVLDVRTKEEFETGHIPDSLNIPLDKIVKHISTLKKYDHIVVCCRSGMRSERAKDILLSSGYKNVTNGGSWQNVRNHLIQH